MKVAERFLRGFRFSLDILKNSNHGSRNRNNNSGTTFECAIVRRDDQRQSSQYRGVSKNTIQKLQNERYVKAVLRRYNSLKPFIADGVTDVDRMNYMTRHGIPMVKQGQRVYSTEYIIRCYTQVMKFIKNHKSDKPKSVTRKVADRLSTIVHNERRYTNPTKAQRYGLTIPSSLKVEPVIRNGERTNIPLSEVLN